MAKTETKEQESYRLLKESNALQAKMQGIMEAYKNKAMQECQVIEKELAEKTKRINELIK